MTRRTRRLVLVLGILIVSFMAGTLVIALVLDDIAWGWWWVVPIGGAFLAGLIALRVAIHRSVDASVDPD